MTERSEDPRVLRSREARISLAAKCEEVREHLSSPGYIPPTVIAQRSTDGEMMVSVGELLVSTVSDDAGSWSYIVVAGDAPHGVTHVWYGSMSWSSQVESLVAGCLHANELLSAEVEAKGTCRNCDGPTFGSTYCSNLCEDADQHPEPRDDRSTWTGDDRWYALHDGWVGEH